MHALMILLACIGAFAGGTSIVFAFVAFDYYIWQRIPVGVVGGCVLAFTALYLLGF